MIEAAAHHYCFSCGTEVRDLGGDRLYLCEPCRQRAKGPSASRFTVKPEGSKPLGPFTHERVIEQLERGVVGGEALVSEGTGEWVRLAQHIEFLPWFVPGDPRNVALTETRGARAAQRSGVRRRELGLRLGLVGVLAASVAGVYFAVQHRLFVLPEEVAAGIQSSVGEAVDFSTRAFRKATDEDYAVAELKETTELPGEEAVQMAKSLWRAPASSVDECLTKAWSGLATGTRAGVELARSQAEQAIVLGPREAGPAATLAATYAALARSDPELGKHSVSLLQRAQAIAQDEHIVLRAGAAVSVANGAFVQAAEGAKACLRSDPSDVVCTWYLGEAQLGLGQIEAAEQTLLGAADRAPEAEGLQLALGRASAQLKRYGSAQPLLETFVGRHGDDATARAAIAHLYSETGRLAEAREHAQRAFELDSAYIEAGLLAGQLLLHVEGEAEEALALLGPLADRPEVARHPRRTEFFVHASHAARMAGEAEAAERYATAAIDGDLGYGPGHLAVAEARLVQEDVSGAEESVKAGEVSLGGGITAGRYHYRTGMLYLELDQARVAQQSMKDAVEAYPDWLAARLGLAMVYLRLDNGFLAVEAFTEGFDQDLERPGRQHPVQAVMLSELGTDGLSGLVREKLANDARMNRYVPRALGVLDGYACLEKGQQCHRAEQFLQKALELDNGDTTAHAWLGRLALRDGRWEDGYNRLTRVAASAGDSPMINAMRGQALYAMQRPDEAEEAFRRALQGGGQIPGVHRLRAESLIEAGQSVEAMAALEEVIRLDPTDMASRAQLLELQLASGGSGG